MITNYEMLIFIIFFNHSMTSMMSSNRKLFRLVVNRYFLFKTIFAISSRRVFNNFTTTRLQRNMNSLFTYKNDIKKGLFAENNYLSLVVFQGLDCAILCDSHSAVSTILLFLALDPVDA